MSDPSVIQPLNLYYFLPLVKAHKKLKETLFDKVALKPIAFRREKYEKNEELCDLLTFLLTELAARMVFLYCIITHFNNHAWKWGENA